MIFATVKAVCRKMLLYQIRQEILQSENRTHICSMTFCPETRAVYEIMCKNMVRADRPQMTIWRTRNSRWIPKATGTHSEYVILIAFPLQQWLYEHASILSYTHTASPALFNIPVTGLAMTYSSQTRLTYFTKYCELCMSTWKKKYRVSQEEWTKLRESVPYVEIYRYNPKHLYPKLNGYGDNGQRKVWTSCISAYCTSTAVAHWPCQCNTAVISVTARAPPNAIRQYFITARYSCAM